MCLKSLTSLLSFGLISLIAACGTVDDSYEITYDEQSNELSVANSPIDGVADEIAVGSQMKFFDPNTGEVVNPGTGDIYIDKSFQGETGKPVKKRKPDTYESIGHNI